MLKPTKKMWARIAAAGIVAAAFASVAIAAETTGTLASSANVVASVAANPAANVSLPAAANQVATVVLDAIAGGSSPSVAASERANGESSSQASHANNGGGVAGVAAGLISAAQRLVAGGTGGERPGWGCGDTNHTHTGGPPGRPDATPPPGCNK